MNGKRIVSLILSAVLLLTAMQPYTRTAAAETIFQAASQTGSDKATPVTSVPRGYTAIYTAADLNGIRNRMSGKFILMNDIVFTASDFAQGGAFYNDGAGWQPIGGDNQTDFTGVLDGNGYSIRGLQMNIAATANQNVGLFYKNEGRIQDLGIEDSTVTFHTTSTSGTTYSLQACFGMFAYTNGENGVIKRCHSDADVTVSMEYGKYTTVYAGGIVSHNYGAIEECVHGGTLQAVSHTTGSSSYYNKVYAGGIVSHNQGTIRNCFQTGTVSTTATAAAYASNNTLYAGGIVSNEKGTVINCHNTGTVQVTSGSNMASTYAGGIGGYVQSGEAMENCSNAGAVTVSTVSGTVCAGGLAGNAAKEILRGYNAGRITVNGTTKPSTVYLGGIVGKADSTVSLCYNLGDLNAKLTSLSLSNRQLTYAGGITGSLELFNNTSCGIENCFNGGNITVSGSNSYCRGYIGGVTGNAGTSTTVSNVVNTGKLTGSMTSSANAYIGGIAGNSYISASGAYYLNTASKASGNGTSSGTSCTATAMKSADTFKSLDFSKTWQFDPHTGYSYPMLRAVELPESTTGAPTGYMPIYTAAELSRALAGTDCGMTKNYYLMNDLEFADGAFAHGGEFYGIFDGNGHTIGNASCAFVKTSLKTEYTAVIAMFRESHGIIRNVTLADMERSAAVSYNAVNVTMTVGGLVGSNYGLVENCSVDGSMSAEITGSGSSGNILLTTGAVVAVNQSDAKVIGCANRTDITGTLASNPWKTHYTGGVVGENNGLVFRCYNAGTIYANSDSTNYTGGVIGNNPGSLIDCFNTGSVRADGVNSDGGGVVGGGSYGALINCYNAGPVSSGRSYGGVIGYGYYNTVTNCYYLDIAEKGIGYGTGVTNPLTLEEMLQQQSYCGFNFDSVWTMAGNGTYRFPELQNVPMSFEKEPIGIRIMTLPATLIYPEGTESLDMTGAVVELIYTGGTTETLSLDTLEITGFDGTITGTQTVTVTYGDFQTGFDVEIKAKTPVSLAVTALPEKQLYLEGEELEPTGLEVTVTYDNRTTETVTDYTLTGYESTPGEKTVTVTWGELTAQFQVTVEAKSLVSIEVTSLPEKLIYEADEELDLTGLEITAHYNNGTSEVVTDYTVSEPEHTSGTQILTVTYQDVQITFEIQVKEVLRGDVNRDRTVDDQDAQLLAEYLAEWDVEIYSEAADYNGDGAVNGKDSILLEQYLLTLDEQ